MARPTVLGIFDSPGDAEKVKDELLHAGVAAHRIVIGRYEDQHPTDESLVVAVVARSHRDKEQIAELMRRHGARDTLEARP